MSTLKETKETPRESGSPSIKPVGTDYSEKRAAYATSSRTVSTKTVAKPGLNAKVDTSAGTSVKPSSSKTTTKKAAGARPTNRRQKAKENAKCVVAGVSTREWPTFKVEEPSKAKYAERKRAAPTKEELTKELQQTLECAKAVLPNFSLEPPVVATKRQKSAEEAKPSAKRPKTRGEMPNRSFAEVARYRIVIGVLDEGDPEGKIPRTQWK
ncbi:uncharacterized protein LOC128920318 [Zeugodacus cucurbitae]|uniref:uncharacterized protein LOC128920318 n=1 Tax=Zeugodacus cucurbitae TaxID=28588 RepID=UPI0023D9399E|nr:uncharacterized protein LOC128920318 [Zeugodacus cucurbitae]